MIKPLSAWGETVSKLIDALESESNIAIDWFTKNEMIINPDKFQAIILDKKKSNLTNIPLTVCSYHVTYAFQSESTLYSCLNVKELLARSRREI